MQAPELSDFLKEFTRRFCGSLSKVFSSTCGSTWLVSLAEHPSSTSVEHAGWFRCCFEGAYAGDVVLAFPAATLSKLQPGDVGSDGMDAAKAQVARLLSGFQQSIADLALSSEEGPAASVRLEEVDAFTAADEQVLELWLQSDPTDPSTRTSLQLCVSQALLKSIQAASAKPLSFPDAAASDAANLDLVMDVELNVMLRFGQRQLALREVLDLASGSVVELDRQVDEPVELVLDGRVIARGEAVIIDGNYGMRITQLIPQVPA